MPTFEFAIDLTAGDNTAFTVRKALRDLGYTGLERVERSDLLRLTLKAGSLNGEDCARRLTHAEIVFNPNKHRLGYAAGGPGGPPEAVVTDKDDDTSNLEALLSSRFGIEGLERVERATAWRLYDASGPASSERLEWACEQLLANPHSQRHLVRQRPAYRQI